LGAAFGRGVSGREPHAIREIQHFITEEAIEEKGFGEIAQLLEI
jgi:hypothetical protein